MKQYRPIVAKALSYFNTQFHKFGIRFSLEGMPAYLEQFDFVNTETKEFSEKHSQENSANSVTEHF